MNSKTNIKKSKKTLIITIIMAVIVASMPIYALAATFSWSVSPTSYLYDGKSHAPKVYVYKNGKKCPSKYYRVDGTGTASKPGTYTLKLVLRNGYSGKSTNYWFIKLGTPSKPSIKVKGKKVTCKTTFKYCDKGTISLYKKSGVKYVLQNQKSLNKYKYIKTYKKCKGEKSVTYSLKSGVYRFIVEAQAGSHNTQNYSSDFVID